MDSSAMFDLGRSGGDAGYREATTVGAAHGRTARSARSEPVSGTRPRGARPGLPEARCDGWHGGRTAGRFLLGGVVGRGAMGEVYSAVDPRTGERAAIKLLQPDAGDHLDTRLRFLRECGIARRLVSPHVARTIDVGETPDRIPYLAMELLDGHDLGWLLRRQGRLPLADVVRLVREVASGLEHAHRAGVVHRDIKPSNLFLARSAGAAPRWKILDFGVAKLDAPGEDLTHGELVGTPGYVSPEQVRGELVDGRADVFGLGAVAYAALTGSPAFFGPDPAQVLFDIVYATPVRPSDLAPGVPADVELVLAAMLAKDRARRLPSAAAAGRSFEAAALGTLPAGLRRRARSLLEEAPWRDATCEDAPTCG